MKLLTETYTLPAHWASYLINGDCSGLEDAEVIEVDEWLRAHPWLGEALSCSEADEFRWENDANDIGGSTVDIVFHVHLTEEREGLLYLVYPVYPTYDPLWWQKQGLSYTASGYGTKIPTSKTLTMFSRRYRVYCDIFSNIGTSYIIYKGKKVIVP